MNIPFIDLKTQFKRIEDDVRMRMDNVLNSAGFIMGKEIHELESQLCEFAGAKHCISCSSGTDALLLPLMAMGIGPGDAVFTTPFTFIATAEVISLLGATPIFVDIDPVTFNIDPDALEAKINDVQAAGTLKSKAILPVDLFGQPADYDRINAIAAAHDLKVIEDAAQAFGATYKGKRTCGSLTEAAATSFFPAKPLGCFGDGGAAFTNDDSIAATMESIRVHGQGTVNKYNNERIGLNARMDTLQAAVLQSKMGIYEDEIAARHRVAATYAEHLGGIEGLTLPTVTEGNTSVWAQYSVLSENRQTLQAQLKAVGCPSAIYYPTPLHLQEAFADRGHERGDFPVAEFASERIFSLPFHPYLEEEQIAHMAGALKQ